MPVGFLITLARCLLIALLPAKVIFASFLPTALGLPQLPSPAKSAQCEQSLSKTELNLQSDLFRRDTNVPVKLLLKKALLRKRRKYVLKKFITRHTIKDNSKIVLSTLFTRGGSSTNTEPRSKDRKIDQHSSHISKNNSKGHSQSMYLACMTVVLVWIATGTLFYSKYNDWPLPQSFFYAVDAGMSIGFCTDVAETTIGSRAFTIAHIILGASCVGGALFLFIKDIMEGLVETRTRQFEQLLAKDAISRLRDSWNHQTERARNNSFKKRLSYKQFRALVEEWTSHQLNDDDFSRLCRRFDPHDYGFIRSEDFLQKCHDVDVFLDTTGALYSKRWICRKSAQLRQGIKHIWPYRIFAVLFAWVAMGVVWGCKRQGWDVITAIHFAISALATGGLTGPAVNDMGILPAEPAIFCGIFCLFGIPLFALTLGHFARFLVEGYVSAVEEKLVRLSIAQPLEVTEFEYAKHLCTPHDPVLHLSDFIILQLLRQNKIDMRTVELIKAQFQALDVNRTGVLELEQAVCSTTIKNDLRNKTITP
mmetsp:Transcript_26481/g.40495  ORF Transcript_26481/g.40495 Transcript_26481/m.40495 type:complete len:535 (-) Transcript_26481:15-1619(-)